MRRGMSRRLGAAVAMTSGIAIFPFAASADLVFRFHNQSNRELRSVVETQETFWLKKGQVEPFRVEGKWRAGSFGGIGPSKIGTIYFLNFQHLSGSGEIYCRWEITWQTYAGNYDSRTRAYVEIYPKLLQSAAGFSCNVTGQLKVYGETIFETDIGGATLDIAISE